MARPSRRETTTNTISKDAITRRLSPLQKTASVAGLKSTGALGEGVNESGIAQELHTREIDKLLQSGNQ